MHTEKQPDEKNLIIRARESRGLERLLEKYEPEQMSALIFAGTVGHRGGLPSHNARGFQTA